MLGTVTDSGGAVVPNASIQVKNVGTDQVQQVATDGQGRYSVPELPVGDYRLTFGTGGYFAATGQRGFYPEVVVTFSVTDPARHHHVPLLLSPFAYSTYLGS